MSRKTNTQVYLIFDHELVALHHDLKLIPASLELTQLLYSTPCHRVKQLVFAFSIQKQWLYPRLLLDKLCVSLIDLTYLLHTLRTN